MGCQSHNLRQQRLPSIVSERYLFRKPIQMGDSEDMNATAQLTVLDLPQLYARPTFNELHQALERLESKPASWDAMSDSGHSTVDGTFLEPTLFLQRCD